LIPKLIGWLLVIAPLDAFGVDGITRILQSTKGLLIQQDRKLVRFDGADFMLTDVAVWEIAKVARERGPALRGRRRDARKVPSSEVRLHGGDGVSQAKAAGTGGGNPS
jgi:ATP-dependent protease Clp ATPase subunit